MALADTRSDRHILVLGATGLIGSAIIARLLECGWPVTAAARKDGPDVRKLQADSRILIDLNKITHVEDWEPHLREIHMVVNCAGVLQSGGRDSATAVHEKAPELLFAACERVGVRRVIHFSAMGADKGALSDFSRTKASAEHALMASALDWVILRPSVVVGRAAVGGSALFRGLAALPWEMPVQDAGRIAVVQLDDVVETVLHFVEDTGAARIALDLAGPKPLRFEEVIASYRRWLGWKPARRIRLPALIMSLGYVLGDLAGQLGWRPPVRSTVRLEMARGAVADPGRWTDATGIVPQSLEDALRGEPASVQERWFARLFLLKPMIIVVFAFFWFLTGVVSLGPGYDIGVDMMLEGGAGPWSGPVVIAGGLADLIIGAAILWRPTTRPALWAALAVTLFYVLVGTAILPRLWDDPLGPMMKVWPILALNLVALAILDAR